MSGTPGREIKANFTGDLDRPPGIRNELRKLPPT